MSEQATAKYDNTDTFDDPDVKLIILGDSAVGKSKLVERFLESDFNPRYVTWRGIISDKTSCSLVLVLIIHVFSLHIHPPFAVACQLMQSTSLGRMLWTTMERRYEEIFGTRQGKINLLPCILVTTTRPMPAY
mmetsp:Transcript_33582/g.67787  ORF Transcript_33582/g.67787 Transcript_33582/m.67787 type:complete len:133 (+) Transcript_33582:84-482(+)